MVLLPKIQEAAIVDNLKKRYMDDLIFVSFFNIAKLYPCNAVCGEAGMNFTLCILS